MKLRNCLCHKIFSIYSTVSYTCVSVVIYAFKSGNFLKENRSEYYLFEIWKHTNRQDYPTNMKNDELHANAMRILLFVHSNIIQIYNRNAKNSSTLPSHSLKGWSQSQSDDCQISWGRWEKRELRTRVDTFKGALTRNEGWETITFILSDVKPSPKPTQYIPQRRRAEHCDIMRGSDFALFQ